LGRLKSWEQLYHQGNSVVSSNLHHGSSLGSHLGAGHTASLSRSSNSSQVGGAGAGAATSFSQKSFTMKPQQQQQHNLSSSSMSHHQSHHNHHQHHHAGLSAGSMSLSSEKSSNHYQSASPHPPLPPPPVTSSATGTTTNHFQNQMHNQQQQSQQQQQQQSQPNHSFHNPHFNQHHPHLQQHHHNHGPLPHAPPLGTPVPVPTPPPFNNIANHNYQNQRSFYQSTPNSPHIYNTLMISSSGHASPASSTGHPHSQQQTGNWGQQSTPNGLYGTMVTAGGSLYRPNHFAHLRNQGPSSLINASLGMGAHNQMGNGSRPDTPNRSGGGPKYQ